MGLEETVGKLITITGRCLGAGYGVTSAYAIYKVFGDTPVEAKVGYIVYSVIGTLLSYCLLKKKMLG